MKLEQKVQSSDFKTLHTTIDQHLKEGWLVKTMVSDNTGTNSVICVVFEREASPIIDKPTVLL